MQPKSVLQTVLALMVLMLFTVPAHAQTSNPDIQFVTTNPVGVCSVGVPLRYNVANGTLWGCNAGTWTQVGSSSGATIPSTTNLIAGDGAGNGADSGIAPATVVKGAASCGTAAQVPYITSAGTVTCSAGLTYVAADNRLYLNANAQSEGIYISTGGIGMARAATSGTYALTGFFGVASTSGLFWGSAGTGYTIAIGRDQDASLGALTGTLDITDKKASTGATRVTVGLGAADTAANETFVNAGTSTAVNVRAVPVAVGSLPTCNAGMEGAHASVNDSNATSFTLGIGAVVANGGTTKVPVYCDGTNWRIG